MAEDINSIKEKTIMDIVTGSIYSLNFLKNITEAIFDPRLHSLSVGEVYEQWHKMCGYPKGVIPYNFGVIMGSLYCGILLAKEQWFNLLPEDKLEESNSDWGFSSATYYSPQKPSPTIKYTFRRIRNALGHGNIFFDFPSGIKKNSRDKADFEKKLTVKFHDVNPRDANDIFDIEISLLGLLTAIKQFHKTAYIHVTKNNHLKSI